MVARDDEDDFKVFLTASEAYPEMERLFLAAEQEISCGFRVFDPFTKLHSPEALEIGDMWFDLIAHVLRKGITISMILTDFDPVARPDEHRHAWRSLRALRAAAELSGRPELLQADVAMHPARVGWLPRLGFWPKSYSKLRETADRLNGLSAPERNRILNDSPLLERLLVRSGTRVRPRIFPPAPLVPATHHQKIAVVDRHLLYVGGLDVNDRRYDTLEHAQSGEETWHDVQITQSGLPARAAHEHLERFRQVLDLKADADSSPVLRTLSRRRRWALPYLSPLPLLNELDLAHKRAAASAERLIYLETQFFRDTSLAEHLAEQAHAKPDLTCIVILPAAPQSIAFSGETPREAQFGEERQVECIGILQDAFGARLFTGSPAQPRDTRDRGRASLHGAPLVYLHAKVSIFDEAEALVSSANLNGRSMRWDTELGVSLTKAEQIAELKRRCFTHWLGGQAGDEFHNLPTAMQAWKDRARDNAALPPTERTGFLLPYPIEGAEADAKSLPGVPEEMV